MEKLFIKYPIDILTPLKINLIEISLNNFDEQLKIIGVSTTRYENIIEVEFSFNKEINENYLLYMGIVIGLIISNN